MTLALGSVLLSLLNLASAALIAERHRAGWLVALAAQIPWTWYDLWTRQLGFLLLTFIYVPVYVRGWRKARTLARLPSSTAGGSPAAEAAGTLGNEVVVTLAEPGRLRAARRLSCPVPPFPSGAARWIYLLLGLSPRSTHTCHWGAGQS